MWLSLIATFLLFGFSVARLQFNNDITQFFPSTYQQQGAVFQSLDIKDRIAIIISYSPSDANPDALCEIVDSIEAPLQTLVEDSLLQTLELQVNASIYDHTLDYIYNHLPILLTDSALMNLDSLIQSKTLDIRMQANQQRLMSGFGMGQSSLIQEDPLGLADSLLKGLTQMNPYGDFTLYNDYLFTADYQTLLLFVNPTNGTKTNANNKELVDRLEQIRTLYSTNDIKISCYGGPLVAVCNARRIQKDVMWTVNGSLLLIALLICLAFKRKRTLFIMLLPVVYGSLFALSMITFWVGNISAIAIGTGAVVIGIALSYSIHILTHAQHCKSVEQVIEEMVGPLTIGSITTFGAFAGLLFTQSPLLQDFGRFSSLTLIGTMVFCLIYLPQLLSIDESVSSEHSNNIKREKGINRLINRINEYAFDRNKWLVLLIFILAFLSLFFFRRVKFDNRIDHLNYETSELHKAGLLLDSMTSVNQATLLVSESLTQYDQLHTILENSNNLNDSVDAYQWINSAPYIVSDSIQKIRIARWNTYFTDAKKQEWQQVIEASGVKYGFNSKAFQPFITRINKAYKVENLVDELLEKQTIFSHFLQKTDDSVLLLSQVWLTDSHKETLYPKIAPVATIIDKGHFINLMSLVINSDFTYILWMSGLLIFVVLFLTYGRIELALLAFLPMSLSWIIILGIMALCGWEFNIVNIILSTFIFGVGDDFSIFVLDGLTQEYARGKKMLQAHKSAIFFSSMVIFIAMGALIFALHPAIKSLGLISLLGISVVVLVAYIAQPFLFRILVTNQARKTGIVYTATNVMRTLYAFITFLTICISIQLIVLPLLIVPMKKSWRHHAMTCVICYTCRLLVVMMPFAKRRFENSENKAYHKPGIIIANHQSFIDLIILMAQTPKLVIVVKTWVWHNPFFGLIIRAAGYLHVQDGIETIQKKVQQRIQEGYSILIFPEGTRSVDLEIHPFKKGAFHLAKELNLDIVPMVLYGNGMLCHKSQPFLMNPGIIACHYMPRITPKDLQFGETARLRKRAVRQEMQRILTDMRLRYDRVDNPYFYSTLINNYAYKDAVAEKYLLVKVLLEDKYRWFDTHISRDARVVDVGCGYGPLLTMLHLLAPKRQLLGIDYDARKIEIAAHSHHTNHYLQFKQSDALEYDYPQADVFILNDMLHYLTPEKQTRLLKKCSNKLAPGGQLLVRDGDTSQPAQSNTELTEKWSTRILKFNKTQGPLHFIDQNFIQKFALENALDFEIIQQSKRTSNTLYRLTQRK